MNFYSKSPRLYFNISILAYHYFMSNILCSESMGSYIGEDTFNIINDIEKEEIIEIDDQTDNTFFKNANNIKIKLEFENDSVTKEYSYKKETNNINSIYKSKDRILNDLFEDQKKIAAKIGFFLIQNDKKGDSENFYTYSNFKYLYLDLISLTEKLCIRMLYFLKKFHVIYHKKKKDTSNRIQYIRKIQNLIAKKKMNSKKRSEHTKVCLKEFLKKIMNFRTQIYCKYRNQSEKQKEMVEILIKLKTSSNKTISCMRNIFEEIKGANFNYILKVIPKISDLLEEDVYKIFRKAYKIYNASLNSLLEIDRALSKFFEN